MSFERDEYLPLDLSAIGKCPIWVPGDDRLALVHSDAYANWVFSNTHPTQGRRFSIARERLLDLAPSAGVEIVEIESDYLPTFPELARVHDPAYVERVVVDGESGEWNGARRDLGALALRMAGGTRLAAQALLDGRAHTAVHFAGAKHHAMRDRSSGFCVFNDFAYTAKWILDSALKVYSPITMRWKRVERIAILDIDAHHGDGTEALLYRDDRVQTFSIHDRSIFPGTGHHDDEGWHVFNQALEPGSGDIALDDAVSFFVGVAQRFDPDLIFIAMGADGLAGDPLSSLTYTADGMVEVVRNVRGGFREVPMLLGGAGGYQPDDETPEVWARMALAAAQPVDQNDHYFVDFSEGFDYCREPDIEEGEVH